ncbi:MAG: hypothetical protein AVDCRST_MAG18-1413 [uncultured Thermomicrobiales bacterium]|uniref:Uncharacterized protein n=1 Tax=uncultured Thermomicrobiales bacterium TaxID=1645740 RepID=A0A6J4V2W0_9BACT|nr:MAG: hypothetical protein AVDCRST_MAG18-1413 [uncultured Thermomicrobiales bacterium]
MARLVWGNLSILRWPVSRVGVGGCIIYRKRGHAPTPSG